ncbi:hypothetical protein [Shinella sumterensis]|uniref:Uncharacterized protein n=1 Tax=Shinella sumterensis TaxID=1967501 RepID=A0AA50CQN3_9HYPH|nr:hypothetical protein [Shinella sumterensis]WLS01026.1 hypothetical protein Q9313_26895 [Shinella sumterensis]WLS11809.1 hypothetical protein Q9314_27655 [Shinella sumterensis]
MSKLDILALYTKLSGFKVQVSANRLGCTSRFARVVHDRLIDVLDLHIATCRRAMSYERRARLEHRLSLEARLWDQYHDCLGDLECGSRAAYPWHLLDHVVRDPDLGGYRHPVAGVWCKGPIPEWMTVSCEHLDGLGAIIEAIAGETGLRFTVYLTSMSIGPEGPNGLDPDVYENPARAG